jgi:hypothetical protein
VNWGLYGVLCVQTCKDLISSSIVPLYDPCIDVYSYNFPRDRRMIKVLGECSGSVGVPDEVTKNRIAYFTFLLETIQTILTGSDVYYWFIEGFGDVERLKQSHFAPIDIPLVHAVISLVVQQYFCYRIWMLNKRSAWFCIVIAIVRVSPLISLNTLTLPG